MKKTGLYSLICFFLDQIIKLIIISNMKIGDSISIIKNFFSITFVSNKGAAFSIMSSSRILLIIITTVVLLLLYFYIKKTPLTNFWYIIYGVLAGGIMGNLFDRIVHLSVIDYLNFHILGYTFPIFNLADIMIVTSVIIIICGEIKDEYQSRRR